MISDIGERQILCYEPVAQDMSLCGATQALGPASLWHCIFDANLEQGLACCTQGA